MKIVIAAGGTGGHILPALTIARKLQSGHENELRFVGVGKQLERDLICGAGFILEEISFVPVLGGGLRGILKMLLSFPKAFIKTLKFYREFRPNVVVGFGGYPSFMPLVVAKFLQIPCLLHEPNAEAGLANKFLSLFVNKILAVSGAKGFWRSTNVQSISVPVRDEFYLIKPWKVNGRFSILVLGGSQGSVSINNAILKLADFFKDQDISLVHQTGKQDYSRVVSEYNKRDFKPEKILPYIDNVCAEYEKANLVICRAGAMTVTEVVASRRPAIFVPLAIAGGHQGYNIAELESCSACLVINEKENFHIELQNQVRFLVENQNEIAKIVLNLEKFRGGRKSSAEIFAEEIRDLVKK